LYEVLLIFANVNIYQDILLAKQHGKQLLAVLIDPEKTSIEQQVQSAIQIKESSLEVLPTGYILVDGGKESAVERVSSSKPICQTNSELILRTALAGEFSGKKIIYLEAGSGAKTPVKSSIISLVKENLTIPLIIGGGIQTVHQLTTAYAAGADLVVIGTAFEKDPAFFNIIKKDSVHENIS